MWEQFPMTSTGMTSLRRAKMGMMRLRRRMTTLARGMTSVGRHTTVAHPRITVTRRSPHDLACLHPDVVSGDVSRAAWPLPRREGAGEPHLVIGSRPDPRLRHGPASFRR